jgi:hypothetical protein
MKRSHGAGPTITATQQAINSTAVTTGGIYLATHCVVVAVAGTIVSTLLTAWALWLVHRRTRCT